MPPLLGVRAAHPRRQLANSVRGRHAQVVHHELASPAPVLRRRARARAVEHRPMAVRLHGWEGGRMIMRLTVHLTVRLQATTLENTSSRWHRAGGLAWRDPAVGLRVCLRKDG